MSEQIRVKYGSVDTVLAYTGSEADIKAVLAESFTELASPNAKPVWGRDSAGLRELTFVLSEGRKAAEQIRVKYGSVDTVLAYTGSEADIKAVLAESFTELASPNAKPVWGRDSAGLRELTFVLSEGRKA